MMQAQKQNKVKIWFQAVRAFSLTASILPVLLGAAIAMHYTGKTTWLLLPVALICSLLLQAGTNAISDYYDYKNKVDSDYTYCSSRVIVDGLLPAKSLLTAGIIAFLTASLLGVILIAARGWPVLILGVIGLLGGFFYTAKPIGYKYIALGDLLVFILMGPLMVIGSDFVLTGQFHKTALIASLPVGCLVAAILHANNLRDIKHDTQAGVKTFANVLGHKGARIEYYILLLSAYLAVAAMVAAQILSMWSLLVFLSLPVALKRIKLVHKTKPEDIISIAQLDVQTAQLHMLFCILLVTGVAAEAIL